MADSNRFQLSYQVENPWGTISGTDAFLELPITDGSGAADPETLRSSILRDDAQQGDLKRIGVNVSPSYNTEFMASIYDEFLRGILRASAWTADVDISGTDIEFSESGNLITSTSTVLSGVAVGQLIRIGGCTGTDSQVANNTWWKVTAVDTYSLTVTGGTLADWSVGTAITIKSSQLVNGTSLHSYAFQHHFQDLTDKYLLYVGNRINAFSLAMSEGGIITATMSFDGKQRSQADSSAGSEITDATAKDVVTEVQGVDGLWLDETLVSEDIFNFSLDLAVTNRPRKALGNLHKTTINQGPLLATGSFEMYLDNDTWEYDSDLDAFNPISLRFALDMQDGDYYCIEMPQVHYTANPGTVPGQDSDVMLNLSFEADPGGTYGAGSDEKTVQICRVLA